ncbi:MAG: hypothetical protein U1E51_31005 [Candidatus Binatia bacterium]|nr:hypothetical protein [Candidatus Binatia bacterium]
MGTPRNGSTVLLYAGGSLLGFQRDVTFDRRVDEIDISSKESRAFRVIAGRTKYTAQCDALYIDDDAAYMVLDAAADAGTLITVVKNVDSIDEKEAEAIVSGLSDKHHDQGVSTVSLTLTIDNGWAASS